MVPELINFAIGISILLLSTNFFVDFSRKISLALRISPLVIGLTIVSIGTTLPEFTVSTLASLKNDPGLASGNVLGSVIANILLVYPIGIMFSRRMRIGTTKTPKTAILFLAAGILYLILQFGSYPGMFAGLLLISAAGLYTLAEITWGVTGRHQEDHKQFRGQTRIGIYPVQLLFLLVSVFGILAGGTMVVASVENLSVLTGLTTTFFGLTVTAVATSLPELFAAVLLGARKEDKTAIGNIIGSNMYNLLLVGGVVKFYATGVTDISLVDWGFFILAIVILISLIMSYRGRSVPKVIGVAMCFIYLLYLLSQIF